MGFFPLWEFPGYWENFQSRIPGLKFFGFSRFFLEFSGHWENIQSWIPGLKVFGIFPFPGIPEILRKFLIKIPGLNFFGIFPVPGIPGFLKKVSIPNPKIKIFWDLEPEVAQWWSSRHENGGRWFKATLRVPLVYSFTEHLPGSLFIIHIPITPTERILHPPCLKAVLGLLEN